MDIDSVVGRKWRVPTD